MLGCPSRRCLLESFLQIRPSFVYFHPWGFSWSPCNTGTDSDHARRVAGFTAWWLSVPQYDRGVTTNRGSLNVISSARAFVAKTCSRPLQVYFANRKFAGLRTRVYALKRRIAARYVAYVGNSPSTVHG